MPDSRLNDSSPNPYAAPRAIVADVYGNEGATQPVRLFSARGRMGRLRYVCWTSAFLVAAILLSLVVLVTMGGAGIFHAHSKVEFAQALRGAGGVAFALIALISIGWFVTTLLMTIQRSHDMGWSGWSVLLLFVIVVAAGILAGIVARSSPVSGGLINLASIPFSCIWYIKPGTPDSNRFGPVPTPTPLAVQIFGWIFAVLTALDLAFFAVRAFGF